MCVCVCVVTHRVSSPAVSEEALGLGGRLVVGMLALEGTTSVVSVMCIYVYTRRYDMYKVMNYTTDKMPHWFLYVCAQCKLHSLLILTLTKLVLTTPTCPT